MNEIRDSKKKYKKANFTAEEHFYLFVNTLRNYCFYNNSCLIKKKRARVSKTCVQEAPKTVSTPFSILFGLSC